MVDLVSREPYAETLLDKCKEFSIGIGKQLVALGVDAIWAGDDFGAQNGMMISPRLWRSVFKPRFREVFAEMKAVNPDVLIGYHCDGAIAPILDDLIQIETAAAGTPRRTRATTTWTPRRVRTSWSPRRPTMQPRLRWAPTAVLSLGPRPRPAAAAGGGGGKLGGILGHSAPV